LKAFEELDYLQVPVFQLPPFHYLVSAGIYQPSFVAAPTPKRVAWEATFSWNQLKPQAPLLTKNQAQHSAKVYGENSQDPFSD
jgi:hypothetical protein